MNKQQKSYNQRFPYGRDSWKFAGQGQRKLIDTFIKGGLSAEQFEKALIFSCSMSTELSLEPTPPYNVVEIPAEIVEHIYRMGWDDARDAAREVVAHEL